MRAAVFGPRPGRRRNCVTSSGTSARRFSSADISPVSVSSTIFASIVAPIPESSFAFPASASSAIDAPVSRMRVAARRYASTRNPCSPRISETSARASNASATSALRGSEATRRS